MLRSRTASCLLVLPFLLAAVAVAQIPLQPAKGYRPEKKLVRLWNAKCATCHGEDGRGRTEQGREMGIADMTKAAYWKDVTLESARKAVLEGIKRTVNGKEQEMKPFADRLQPRQVDDLNRYAASLAKK